MTEKPEPSPWDVAPLEENPGLSSLSPARLPGSPILPWRSRSSLVAADNSSCAEDVATGGSRQFFLYSPRCHWWQPTILPVLSLLPGVATDDSSCVGRVATGGAARPGSENRPPSLAGNGPAGGRKSRCRFPVGEGACSGLRNRPKKTKPFGLACLAHPLLSRDDRATRDHPWSEPSTTPGIYPQQAASPGACRRAQRPQIGARSSNTRGAVPASRSSPQRPQVAPAGTAAVPAR